MSDQSITSKERELTNMAELMETYGNAVLRLAYSYVGDHATAEDMFQEVFLKAYTAFADFRGECSMKTWLFRITVNTCKDYLKSAYRKRTIFLEEEVEEAVAASNTIHEVECEIDKRARGEIVRKALSQLPEKYRDVCICMYFEERSVAETARLLGLSEGTVKSRLSRARDRLRELLKDEWKGGAANE